MNFNRKKRGSSINMLGDKAIPKINVLTPSHINTKRNSPAGIKDNSTTLAIKEEDTQQKTNETTATKKKELKKRMTIELSILRKTTMKKKKTHTVNFEVIDEWAKNKD